MTAQEMWEVYRLYDPGAIFWSAWSFGGDPDELADLVLRGVKTATTSLLYWYERENEPLPEPGNVSVILDSWDQAVCVIRTSRVYTLPFSQVTEDHAFREGEGDRTLEEWQYVHEKFFRQELAEVGVDFSPDMPVVCEEFERVWPLDELAQ